MRDECAPDRVAIVKKDRPQQVEQRKTNEEKVAEV
jgi:hypothetical protein